ncbi:dTDP-glucose 4,6-dehydratase [Deinococcus sp. Marseille-Q6407]|uniref:dTDP-glucose 4,6-dehydratase n=1 Tax=Deinococcus sp. Marseille-Q6407 TaxID=2969223 RepID=UPI0021C0644A|nr:dTDP-glucose 4,6-dehydratase [Deinococcus sp. Marseille-Q6407]
MPEIPAPPLSHLLVTGGLGFIGSHFVRHWLSRQPASRVTVLDKLTYAASPERLADLTGHPRLRVVTGDITDGAAVRRLCEESGVDMLVNFAAETHVDQSIQASQVFTLTNVLGTQVLLDIALALGLRFHQVSTDEVYGDIPAGQRSREDAALLPRSPYSASKAAADHFTLAYVHTHGLHATITRGSNTVGAWQHLEKVVSLFATNALLGEPLPLYGDGWQQRDYLDAGDHCSAIALVLEQGAPGEIFNVGTGTETANRRMAELVLETLDAPRALLRQVADRPGHDRRYALNTSRLGQLGWQPRLTSEQAIVQAARWYRQHPEWWRALRAGDFGTYYRRQYAARLAGASSLESTGSPEHSGSLENAAPITEAGS